MTPIPLAQAFTEARDRLVAITAIAMPELVQIKPFVDTQGITMPYGEMVVPSEQISPTRGGQQDITLALEVRIFCDEAFAGTDGELQNTIYFNWLPTITQTYIKYARLACPPTYPQSPSWLNEANTGLQRAQVILDQQWLMVFYWQLAFNTRFVCI